MEEPSESHLNYLAAVIAETGDAYRGIINRLWAGNGGAAALLVTVTKPTSGCKWSDNSLLVPLAIYSASLLCLAFGEIYLLNNRREELRNAEAVDNLMSMKAGVIRRPSERIGISGPHVATAIIAAALFVFATVLAIGMLFHQ